MTTTEAASALKVTPRGLFSLIDRGELRAARAERLPREDVEIYRLEQP